MQEPTDLPNEHRLQSHTIRDQLSRPFMAWLALNERRQLRRVRMWDPSLGNVRQTPRS